MKYLVFNRQTWEPHGEFDTLDEALGCVLFDRLVDWAITYNDVVVRSRELDNLVTSRGK